MKDKPCIGRGAQADVYRDGPYAYKLFHRPESRAEAFFEAAITTQVAATGLPVAAVYSVSDYQGHPVIQMEYIEGTDMNRMMQACPAEAARRLEELANLQRRVHRQRPYLPTRVKDVLRSKLSGAPGLSGSAVRRLWQRLEKLPEGDCLCHGDFHGGNIIVHQGRHTVIDWVDAALGCLEADACRSYMIYALYDGWAAEQYLDAYCTQAECAPQRVLDWLPVVAGARLRGAPNQERARLLAWAQAE